MGIGNRIITFIKKSKLTQITFAVFSVVVIPAKIIPAICHAFYSGVMANLMTMIFQIAFFIATAGIFFFFAKSEIYKKRTDGRSLIADQRMYGRDQLDLMQHFQRDPRKLDIKVMPQRKWTLCEGIIFGKLDGRTICRPSSSDGNVMLFAAPGVGKTMGQVIPTALQFRGSVFAIDIKGDISAYTSGRRRIKFFDPDDASSCHFDPLATVRSADLSMRGLAIEQIADILIPQTSKGDGAFFEQGAHDLFCGIANFCFVKKPTVTFPKMINAILTKDVDYWLSVINSSNIFDAKKYTADLTENNKKNLSGCYSQMTKCLRPFTNGHLMTLLTQSDNIIQPSDLEAGSDVYIRVKQEHLGSAYAAAISLIVNSFFEYFKSRPDVYGNSRLSPILFMLDEAPVALRFLPADAITDALQTLRSKKITCFLVSQSRAALISRYGMHGATMITDTCRYVSVMSATDPESSRFFAEMIGKTKTLKAMGESSSETEDYIIRPEQLSSLGDQVVILADGKYVIADKIKCWQDIMPTPAQMNQIHETNDILKGNKNG